MTVVTLLIGAAFILLPLFWIVDTAFKPVGDAFVIPPKFVYTPTLGNFRSLIGGQYNQFLGDMGHSLIIMAISVTIAMLLGVPAGLRPGPFAISGKWCDHGLAHRGLHRPCAGLHRPPVRHLHRSSI